MAKNEKLIKLIERRDSIIKSINSDSISERQKEHLREEKDKLDRMIELNS